MGHVKPVAGERKIGITLIEEVVLTAETAKVIPCGTTA